MAVVQELSLPRWKSTRIKPTGTLGMRSGNEHVTVSYCFDYGKSTGNCLISVARGSGHSGLQQHLLKAVVEGDSDPAAGCDRGTGRDLKQMEDGLKILQRLRKCEEQNNRTLRCRIYTSLDLHLFVDI